MHIFLTAIAMLACVAAGFVIGISWSKAKHQDQYESRHAAPSAPMPEPEGRERPFRGSMTLDEETVVFPGDEEATEAWVAGLKEMPEPNWGTIPMTVSVDGGPERVVPPVDDNDEFLSGLRQEMADTRATLGITAPMDKQG